MESNLTDHAHDLEATIHIVKISSSFQSKIPVYTAL